MFALYLIFFKMKYRYMVRHFPFHMSTHAESSHFTMSTAINKAQLKFI